MQIRNPFPDTEPLKCLAITASGNKYPLSMISTPLVTVPDDVTELLVEWTFPWETRSKAWTKTNGWLEISEYNERKAFETEKANLAIEKKRILKRTAKPEVTPQNENDPPTSD